MKQWPFSLKSGIPSPDIHKMMECDSSPKKLGCTPATLEDLFYRNILEVDKWRQELQQFHIGLLEKVLEILKTNGLVANPAKCIFEVDSIDFLIFFVWDQMVSPCKLLKFRQ
jgi:hypothetical protein